MRKCQITSTSTTSPRSTTGPARTELDAKGYDKTKEAVAKAADYLACFASRVEVLDVVSQRPILADATAFRARFQTVFRESGRELQLRSRAPRSRRRSRRAR